MSGHSKWAQIKHQKGTVDAKKSKAFAKLSQLISFASKKGGNPSTNASLRDAIAKAKAANMPSDNIERAIKRGSGELKEGEMEEVIYEIFGPGGCAILIKGITDNKNRTLGEVKHILSNHGLQLAGAGSCLWAFNPAEDGTGWRPKHIIENTKENQEKLKELFKELDELDDIQNITANCIIED